MKFTTSNATLRSQQVGRRIGGEDLGECLHSFRVCLDETRAHQGLARQVKLDRFVADDILRHYLVAALTLQPGLALLA